MIHELCGIFNGSGDVVTFEIWKILQDFGSIGSGSEHVENVFDSHPQPPDARAATENLGVDRDALEMVFHGLPHEPIAIGFLASNCNCWSTAMAGSPSRA